MKLLAVHLAVVLFHQIQAKSLHDTLVDKGLNDAADWHNNNPSTLLNTGSKVTIFAPTNDAMQRNKARGLIGNYRRQFPDSADINAYITTGDVPPGGISFLNTPDRGGEFGTANKTIADTKIFQKNPDRATSDRLVKRQGVFEPWMPPPTPPSSIAQLNTGFGKAAFILEEGIEFDEGRIHVIDALFTPAGSFIEGLEEAGFVELGNIFDTRFPALRAELDTASHLTFFAPARYVLEDARPELSGLSDSELEALINYHTLDLTTGFIGYTTSLECGKIYKTKGGGKVVVTFNGLDTYINDAKIIGRDLILQNGVMHVLDKILELQSPEATTLPGPNGTVIDINNIQGCTTPTPTPEVAGNATNTPTYRPPQQTGSAEATRGSPLKTVIAAFAAVGLTLF